VGVFCSLAGDLLAGLCARAIVALDENNKVLYTELVSEITEEPDYDAWYSAKVLVFGFLLIIGLKLRFIMREWTELFRVLAADPDDQAAEATLEKSIRVGRGLAYLYWIGIATVAFFGAVKPF